MSQITQNSVFIDDLKESIQDVIEKDNIELGEQRIIVTVDANGIRTKVVTQLARKPRESKFDSKTAKRLQEAKQVLKGRRDLIYIVTLLISLSNELKKIKADDLIEGSRKLLTSAAVEVQSGLASLTKEIER